MLFPRLVSFGPSVSARPMSLPEFSGQRTAYSQRVDSEGAEQPHRPLRASIVPPRHTRSVNDRDSRPSGGWPSMLTCVRCTHQ
jgi:hypothetical protein